MRWRRPGRRLAERLEGYSFFMQRRPLIGSWRPYTSPYATTTAAYLNRRQIAWWLDGLRLGIRWPWGPYGPYAPKKKGDR